MTKEPISLKKVKSDFKQIVHKKISRAWNGYGSALFLELGDLHNELAWGPKGKPQASLTGEWTLSSDGAWKLLREGKELFDAEKASRAQINDIITNFEGLIIIATEIREKLILQLSNNDTLEFHKADYGFFTLVANEKKMIIYEDNSPYLQQAVL